MEIPNYQNSQILSGQFETLWLQPFDSSKRFGTNDVVVVVVVHLPTTQQSPTITTHFYSDSHFIKRHQQICGR